MTHLVVGEYDTPKYRYVAKERPDIRPMAAGWIEAVRDLWVEDADIDFVALEETWRLRAFETNGGDSNLPGTEADRGKLLCCLTGFDDPDERQEIIDMIVANGGGYTGDLTRKVTHLLVHKPEGRKYTAAKSWEVQTVSIEWLRDSIQRGMILDERCYDPLLPIEERGKGAWTRKEVGTVSLGKRLRDGAAAAQDEGKRKLRKTASMKLNSQRGNLWGDILGKPPTADRSAHPEEDQTQPNAPASLQAHQSGKSLETQGSKLASLTTAEDDSVFAACCFYVYGFPTKKAEILVNTVTYLGGLVCHSLDEVASNSGAQLAHRFLIVPQESRPDTHPALPHNVQIVTEFFIEKCLHKKEFFNPNDNIIGQPFPVFPIDGFEALAICTAGFVGVDLNQVDKAIRQLGARYDERFTSQSSLLLCRSLGSVRKQKLDLALAWKVPVVSAEWLWSCISTGFKVPIKDFLFPELRQRLSPEQGESSGRRPEEPKKLESGKPDAATQKPTSKASIRDIDMSAFTRDDPENDDASAPRKEVCKENSDATTHYETALTHQSQAQEEQGKLSAPLSEVSSNSRNQSLSPLKHAQPPRKPRSRVPSEIANSEATDEPNDMDTDIADENEMPAVQDADAGATRRSRLEEEKAARMAAERLALSAKLTTLLGSTIGGAATGGNAVPGPENHVDATGPGSAPTAAPVGTRPTRRRREIMGRAISNVSAASSGSVESVGGASAVSNLKALSAAGSFSAGLMGGVEGDGAPSSTQLGYEDPDANKCKAQLMSKMLGTDQKTAAAATGRGARVEERLTLAELGGYETARSKTAAGTRSRRK